MMLQNEPGLLALTCIGVDHETPTIRTFRLRGTAPITYTPGQALVLKVPLPFGPAWRTFTISGGANGDLHLTIKAQGQGGATRWLHDNLTQGAEIQARSPRGHFTLDLRGNDRLAFVSGGSGATPMIAMLRHLADTQPLADVAWFHAARDPDEVLFAAELAQLQARMPNLTVAISVSRPAPGWFGYRGRISRTQLSTAIPDIGRREVFCCGPQGFMTEARLIHAAEGGDKAQFHTESFGGAPVPVATPEPVAAGGPAFAMTVAEREIQIRPDESVLQASLRHGVIIPCGCGEGMCGTCMVRLVEGQVAMVANGGITPEEQAQGYILACSSRAVSDIKVTLA
ncbi:hybrid-cluster NAD(P)-dependent oxidoreductase [Paracoccus laeviglucosivorans]|uniref:Ferredoxin-NADP reductase n=1 Tax=Paracoccus laeviglucosivorans TaxID=1197861 RepID=A0A521BJC4_9RHOB|nr:hybrid-cluster NAD(P)-dependent oxidoreductase [Paracoccus laeviglucosivorans]SMO47267.1 Ferredoxin-NADP reductase [Paracoccus laeviglucosivorans]